VIERLGAAAREAEEIASDDGRWSPL
jgi:hypothetical protein